MPTVVPSTKSTKAVFRPDCPVCQKQMLLARVEPAGVRHDLRTFECAACQHSETVHMDFGSDN